MGAYSAYGLAVDTALPLPGDWRAPVRGQPGVTVEPSVADAISDAWSGFAEPGWTGWTEGRRFTVEHGVEGDARLVLEAIAEFHLSASGDRLLAAAEDLSRADVLRVLLDSVLASVSLRTGYEAMHAGAVDTPHGVIAVAGATGAGKSSLIVALLGRGADFFSDDIVALRRCDDGVLALPGPPVMTVPAGGDVPGKPLADLGGERWVAVQGAPAPRPLTAVILLCSPSGGEGDKPPSMLSVLGHLLRYPRTAERERSRFELASDLVARVPIIRLNARSGTPMELADQALRRLGVWRTVTT